MVAATPSADTPVSDTHLFISGVTESSMRPSRKILVFTTVGHSAVTVMPAPAVSAASVSDSASTAALLAL